jgi:hypothetical protein
MVSTPPLGADRFSGVVCCRSERAFMYVPRVAPPICLSALAAAGQSFLKRSSFCEIEVSEFFNSHPCSRQLSGTVWRSLTIFKLEG